MIFQMVIPLFKLGKTLKGNLKLLSSKILLKVKSMQFDFQLTVNTYFKYLFTAISTSKGSVYLKSRLFMQYLLERKIDLFTIRISKKLNK